MGKSTGKTHTEVDGEFHLYSCLLLRFILTLLDVQKPGSRSSFRANQQKRGT